jgi:hypothetical protein
MSWDERSPLSRNRDKFLYAVRVLTGKNIPLAQNRAKLQRAAGSAVNGANPWMLNGSCSECKRDCRAMGQLPTFCRDRCGRHCNATFQRVGKVTNNRFHPSALRNLTAQPSCQAACYNAHSGANERDYCLDTCGRPTFPNHERRSYAQGASCVQLCAGANPDVIDKCFTDCFLND